MWLHGHDRTLYRGGALAAVVGTLDLGTIQENKLAV